MRATGGEDRIHSPATRFTGRSAQGTGCSQKRPASEALGPAGQGRPFRTAGSGPRERPDDGYARFMLALAEERCGNGSAAVASYARAFQALPDLADPRHNPLVLDSRLQTQAGLRYYRESVLAGTLPLTALDPAAVKAMIASRPTPAAASSADGTPLPAPETIAVPTPTPEPTPPPGAPGGGAPLPREPHR